MLKKSSLIIFIIVVTVLVFAYLSTPDATLINYPPQNGTVIAFGDSLVVGVGSTPGNDFVSILGSKLNTVIINKGISGNTSADGLARLDEVIALNPGTVLLLLGGNDAIKRAPVEQTAENLRAIITTLQSRGVFVVMLGVRGGLLRDNLSDTFDSIAKDTKILYVPDVLDGLFGHPERMSDPIHPNDSGYGIIAERVYDALVEVK